MVIRNITRNLPPAPEIPPPPPPHYTPIINRYVNIPIRSIPPPPIQPETSTTEPLLPPINMRLNVRETSDVEMGNIDSDDEIEEDISMIEENEEEHFQNDRRRRRYEFRYFPR